LPRAHVFDLCRRRPAVALAILEVMAQRVRRFASLASDLAFRPILERLARYIGDAAVSHPVAAGAELDLRLTQAQLAARLGTVRELVARALFQLEDSGVIARKRGRIVIRDPIRLAALARGRCDVSHRFGDLVLPILAGDRFRQEEIMWRPAAAIVLGVALVGAVLAHTVLAQSAPGFGANQPSNHGSMPSHGSDMHAQHMRAMHGMATGAPTLPGQDAFGAMVEVVKILEADPKTDWSKVDLERLRQHLIDMNEVVLHAQVKQSPVLGGLVMDVTGAGRTEQAIRVMVVPHAVELDRMPSYAARTELIPGGVRLTVTVKAPDDPRAVARLRGLGFIGVLTQGAHHGPHHLAMAKGEALLGHGD
jgi:Crp-like helix-turn-helix domain